MAHLSPSAHTEKLLPCSAPAGSDPSAHSQSQNSRASAGGTPSPCGHWCLLHPLLPPPASSSDMLVVLYCKAPIQHPQLAVRVFQRPEHATLHVSCVPFPADGPATQTLPAARLVGGSGLRLSCLH